MKNSFSVKHVFFGWWVVVACFFTGAFGTAVIGYGFTSFIQPFAAEFGWSYAQISLGISLRWLEFGIASPLSGWFVDRWGSHKVVFFGSMITCLGLLLLMQTQSLGVFYAAFVLIGIGASSCALPVIMPTVTNWFRQHLGLATGVAASGMGAAGLFLPVITYIIEVSGWRSAVLVMLLCIVAVVLPLSFVLRHKPEHYGLLPDGKKAAERTEQKVIADEKLRQSDPGLKQAMHTRAFWQLAAAINCLLMVGSAVITHVMPFLASIGTDRYASSFVASFLPLIGIIGRIGFGWLSDRLNRKLITAVTLIMLSLSMICFWLASIVGLWLILPFCLLFGIGYGGALVLGSSLTSELFGWRSFGIIYGLIMGFGVIGNATGAPLAGWTYDTWGTYQWFWFAMAGVAMIGAVIILTISTPSAKTKH